MPFLCCFGGSERTQRTLSPPSPRSVSGTGSQASSEVIEIEGDISALAGEVFNAYINQRISFRPPEPSNPTRRLVGEMTVQQAIQAMTPLSPGGMAVLSQLLVQSRNSKALLTKMDDAGIYDERIWDLHQHVGSGDIRRTFRILLLLRNDRITAEELNDSIQNQRRWSGDLGL